MDSVLQQNKECYVCHTTIGLNDHHIIYGSANRKVSEKYGLKVWLCREHHTGNTGVHFNKDLDTRLKQLAQTYYEEHYGDRDAFRKDFGRSYL